MLIGSVPGQESKCKSLCKGLFTRQLGVLISKGWNNEPGLFGVASPVDKADGLIICALLTMAAGSISLFVFFLMMNSTKTGLNLVIQDALKEPGLDGCANYMDMHVLSSSDVLGVGGDATVLSLTAWLWTFSSIASREIQDMGQTAMHGNSRTGIFCQNLQGVQLSGLGKLFAVVGFGCLLLIPLLLCLREKFGISRGKCQQSRRENELHASIASITRRPSW